MLKFYFIFQLNFFRTILEMKSYAVSMFQQTIFILVIYFLSIPRMSSGQTYQFVKELVSGSCFYSSESRSMEFKVLFDNIMNIVCFLSPLSGASLYLWCPKIGANRFLVFAYLGDH